MKKLLFVISTIVIASLSSASCIPAMETTAPPETPSSQTEVTTPQASSLLEQTGSLTQALVVRVIDGDTIEAIIDGYSYKVRYIGIDTPEVSQSGYEEATMVNASLVDDKLVWLEKDVSETDKYGRLLRYIYVGELFVNAELVRLGYAQVATYPPDVKYQDLFLQLQREAKEAGRGLWGIISTPSPSTGKYVGSINSDIYHYPSCEWAQKIQPANEIWFSSPQDARAHGYRACKVCRPP